MNGKVLSFTALEDFAREFTDGRKLTTLEVVAILGAIPPDLHTQIIAPFGHPATGQMRLSGRIIESGPGFDREEFKREIQDYGKAELTFSDEEVVVSGMMVLFNSMLSQLLNSQISTLSYILLVVFVMFLILLRSLPHALLGMIPNTLAAAMVIGTMGYAGIPLDMMTTTIAAVCIGIGVDDTIHYLHRFREEHAAPISGRTRTLGRCQDRGEFQPREYRPGTVLHVIYRGGRLFGFVSLELCTHRTVRRVDGYCNAAGIDITASAACADAH
jgi:predicted RND superfamily exporter protein